MGFSACTLLSQISNKQSLKAYEHLAYTQFSQIFFKTQSLKRIPEHFSVVFSRLYPILANLLLLLLLLLLQHPLPKNSCAKRTSAFLLQYPIPRSSQRHDNLLLLPLPQSFKCSSPILSSNAAPLLYLLFLPPISQRKQNTKTVNKNFLFTTSASPSFCSCQFFRFCSSGFFAWFFGGGRNLSCFWF